MKTALKTIEFKLTLNAGQQATIEDWLTKLRGLWNLALSYLEEHQQREWRVKNPDAAGGADAVKWYWHVNNGVPALACRISTKWKGEVYSAVEIRRHMDSEDPKLFALGPIRSNKNTPNEEWLHDIPSVFKDGLIENLKTAWDTYKNPNHPGRKPSFKGKAFSLKTIKTRASITITGDRVRIPNLGLAKVKGLRKRWGDLKVNSYQITKRPSGYYLLLTGEVPTKDKPIKKPDVAIGLDPGVSAILTRDDGWKVSPPRYYAKSEAKLKKLQRKIARQQNGSNRQKRTIQRLAKVHEKTRLQRKAFNHRVSTHLVETYGGIAIEKNTVKNMVRRPKPVLKVDGKGYEKNNANAKSGLNKSLLDAATGGLRDMLKTKAKSQGNEFHLVDGRCNSQTCPKCGNIQKKELSERVHDCQECGFKTDRDRAAAMVVRAKAKWTTDYKASLVEGSSVACGDHGRRANKQLRAMKRQRAIEKPSKVRLPEVTGKSTLTNLTATKAIQLTLDFGTSNPIMSTG